MFDYRRSHTCGELCKEHVDAPVTLSGWVHRRRDHGGLIFIDLRDRFGLTQLVLDPEKDPRTHQLAEELRAEWVISIKGVVKRRREGMANPNLATGEIEVEVHDMEVLSRAKTPPLSICDETVQVHEELRLKYRYLDMRRGDIQNRLIQRHNAMRATRTYLGNQGFVEITTPVLSKSTPEGARDYLVPSRIHEGSFYALPQSPQLFKQLLMVGGMDRYFQIAQCFRDEDLRADRQPEFTQIDLEMSFGTQEDLFPILEGMLRAVFKECLGVDITTPFPRLTFDQCMERFGCDRPDTRFGMELVTLTEIAKQSTFTVFQEQIAAGAIVKGLCVKGGADISRREIDHYTAFVGQLGIKGLAWMKMQEGGLSSSIVKFFSEGLQHELVKALDVEVGDLIFMIADQPDRTNQGLDHLRRKLAKERSLIPTDTYDFLWVTDFPLFMKDEETNKLCYYHHPFVHPHIEDLPLLDSEPLKVRSTGYDIVLNGYEIGGGSQRVHNSQLQEKIFALLQLSKEEVQEKFGFFIEALQYGTPPHLGIAFGLDRLMMILTKTDSIRDVIAFPKTQKASDLMMECPAQVESQQLTDLHLKIDAQDFS